MLFNIGLEYSSSKAQENQMGLKLNGTHQFLTDADDVNLQGDKSLQQAVEAYRVLRC
jgi:hypothetical protein